ncbi:hypothetical protein, partial [Paenirhodobacter populi]|uniref:hypothetical protein n=1 Tax=Paenirhodobacter populi TaxID=2306993 RepID=UPI001F4FD106
FPIRIIIRDRPGAVPGSAGRTFAKARDRRRHVDREGTAQAAAVASASLGPSVSAPLAAPPAPSASPEIAAAASQISASQQGIPASSPSLANKSLAGNRPGAQHHEHLLALIRALARDAARADHAAEPGIEHDDR